MKHYKFLVHLPNGDVKTVCGMDIMDAIIQGFELCRHFGLEKRINRIIDEAGNVYGNITLPTYEKM